MSLRCFCRRWGGQVKCRRQKAKCKIEVSPAATDFYHGRDARDTQGQDALATIRSRARRTRHGGLFEWAYVGEEYLVDADEGVFGVGIDGDEGEGEGLGGEGQVVGEADALDDV